jgi:sec-independent protein translocase protein TatA
MYTPLLSVPLIGMPGLWEWILIGLAVMLFFGASKLPKLGRGLGEGIRNFKKSVSGEDQEEALPAEGATTGSDDNKQ